MPSSLHIRGGSINISATENNNHIEIIISDNGIGMSKEKLDTLFKIGENRSEQGTNHETGTGFGLLICKDFIEKHEGKILVKSEVSKGSEFKIILPAYKQ